MTDYEVRLAREEREKRTGIKDPIPPPPPLWLVGSLLSALAAVLIWVANHGGAA